jgi:hypothetical protein
MADGKSVGATQNLYADATKCSGVIHPRGGGRVELCTTHRVCVRTLNAPDLTVRSCKMPMVFDWWRCGDV